MVSLEDALSEYNEAAVVDIQKYINDAKINVRDEIAPPQPLLVQVSSDNPDNDRFLCTLGNLMLISGKAKSRKSFLIVLIIAVLIKNDTINGLKGCLPNNKRVGVLIDTEQGKYHVQKSLKRICKASKVQYPENLNVYALRKFNPAERLKMIESIIYNTPELGYVVIDGIRDLVTSINNEDEATNLMSKLMKWSEELNISIIMVLHQNKSDTNARGHLGTEAVNKAETHISVTKSEANKDISIVEPLQCRNREPETFAFEIIDNIPVLADDYKVRTQKKSSKIDVSGIEDYKLFSMLNSIYSKQDNYNYSSLVQSVKYQFKNDFKTTIGDNKAKDIITYCKHNDFLLQSEAKKPYTLGKYKAVENDL